MGDNSAPAESPSSATPAPSDNSSSPPPSGSNGPTLSGSPLSPPPSGSNGSSSTPSGSPPSPPPSGSNGSNPTPSGNPLPPPPSGSNGSNSSPKTPPPSSSPPPSGPSPPSNNPPPSSTPPPSSPPPSSTPPPSPPLQSPPSKSPPPAPVTVPPKSTTPFSPPHSPPALPPPTPEVKPPVTGTPRGTSPSPAKPSAPTTPTKPSPPSPPATEPQVRAPSTSSSSGTIRTVAIVGISVAGVLIALAAIIFFITRTRKKRTGGFTAQYKTPPGNDPTNADGYYHKPANVVALGAPPDVYHASTPTSSTPSGNSGGSFRGHGYSTGSSGFSYDELMHITGGFSQANLIGQGGFGCVYKGALADGRLVAVKQLKVGSGQGEREFRAEVEIISRVHHRHLVSLVGYCIAEHQRLLVYEFVPNNTLEYHLHEKGIQVMDWPNRMRIAIGSARGLAYLHEDCQPRIIHRDIKSANILLDDFFEAQVADFGLAKLANDTSTHVSTRVMGTFGYMAPEYATSGKLTHKSDVYSFGVVLLELITGHKPIDPSQPLGDESLVEWARPRLTNALATGDYKELVDPRLENNFVHSEMLKMIECAAACVRHSASKRPHMAQVLRALDSDAGGLIDLTNGVKFGQSTVYDSGQYDIDIQKFRKLAFESAIYSSEEQTVQQEHGSSK